tara:strand:- start:11097 stop:12074 length:978 start_codon:yes stop_codon:yes gene_type:complete
MRIFRHWSDLNFDARGAVVAIGNFDGVHCGHQKVIAIAASIAKEKGLPLGVVTFEPHPRTVLSNASEPFRLTPFRAKVEAICATGAEILYVMKFDESFASLTANEFVYDIIVKGLGARHIVVGYDFAFGANRTGNVDLLKSLASIGGYSVTKVEKVQDERGAFSASSAREYILNGNMEDATEVLGRPWEIIGHIRKGDQIGRGLGFPTANLSVANILSPEPGIYAVWAGLHSPIKPNENRFIEWYPAAAYVGRRPTFDKTEELLEVHLLDFDQEIYGQLLRVAFVSQIRKDQKFDTEKELMEQMGKDCKESRRLLSKYNCPQSNP